MKVLWVGAMVFILIFSLVIFLNKIEHSDLLGGAFIVPVIISSLFTIGYCIKGINYYRIIARLINDTSEKSIIPLFDDGFSIENADEKGKIEYTKENFKGTISGLPVEIRFFPADRATWSSLSFSFYSLSKEGFGSNVSRYISFNMNWRNRLKKDVKPEVLKFVADLKERGYSPAPQ